MAEALYDTATAIWARRDRLLFERAVFAAQEAARLSRECDDLFNVAASYGSLGALFTTMSLHDSARVYLRRAIVLHDTLAGRSTNREDSIRVTQLRGATLYQLAVTNRLTGQLDTALAYLYTALPLRRRAADHRGEGRTLNAIGEVLHTLGRRDEAYRAYVSALSVRHTTGDSVGRATTYRNLASILLERGSMELAHGYVDSATFIDEARGDTLALAFDALLHGYWSLRSGNRAEALRYLVFAYGHAERLGDHSTAGHGRIAAGDVLLGLDSAQAALRHWVLALDNLRRAGDQIGMASALQRLGHWYHRVRAPPALDSAVMIYERAAEVLRRLERRSGPDPSRLSFAEEQRGNLFEDWILAELAIAGPLAARSALSVADVGRAQALLDLQRRPDTASATVQLFTGEAPVALRSNESAFYYVITSDTLITWAKIGQDLVVLRSPIPRDTLAALVGAVRRSLGARMDTSLRARVVPLLEQGAVAARGVKAVSSTAVWPYEAARRLSTLLLPSELLDRLPREREVVIFPQGVLNLLPFAALPVTDTAEAFGLLHAIRYAPSLASLGRAEQRIPGQGAALVVGNPVMPYVVTGAGKREQLPPLVGAESEAATVGKALNVAALTGSRATESRVRGALPRASIVHLATHGYAYGSPGRTRDSWIALTPAGGEDGLLTVGEVLDQEGLDLAADLVVLSACQTGMGDLKQGEGTVGFQRAFLAKGARSVLVSLWSVDDKATRLLMEAFYRHWRGDDAGQHVAKAEALRLAQVDLRKQGYQAPVYWAAFQLVGAR